MGFAIDFAIGFAIGFAAGFAVVQREIYSHTHKIKMR